MLYLTPVVLCLVTPLKDASRRAEDRIPLTGTRMCLERVLQPGEAVLRGAVQGGAARLPWPSNGPEMAILFGKM